MFLYLLLFLATWALVALALRALRGAVQNLNEQLTSIENLRGEIQSLKTRLEPSSPERLYQVAADVMGFARDNIVREAELFHDGHAEANWSMDLRAVSQNVAEIEHRYWADGPLDHVGVSLGAEVVDGYKLRIKEVESARKEKTYLITIFPDILVGKSLPIPLKNRTGPGAFAMTAEALKGEDKFEQTSFRVNYPTNHLTLKLTFPPDFVPERAAQDVWYGDSKVRQENEWGRISKRFSKQKNERGALYLLLEIDYPIQGLTYALRWWPPIRGK